MYRFLQRTCVGFAVASFAAAGYLWSTEGRPGYRVESPDQEFIELPAGQEHVVRFAVQNLRWFRPIRIVSYHMC